MKIACKATNCYLTTTLDYIVQDSLMKAQPGITIIDRTTFPLIKRFYSRPSSKLFVVTRIEKNLKISKIVITLMICLFV